MPPQAGSRLGPYELTAPIGAGGMGEVWQARDTRLARDVALKFLPEAVVSDPERLARFRREAQLLAALNHPNIAAIHGLEEVEGQPFLVLELALGEDLAARLKRGPLPLDEAMAGAKQIAEALEEAHEHGIVHRDLKPANVKLTPEGKVKVLDFGLAKAWTGDPATGSSSADLSQSPTLAHGSSEAGLILGTAAYMSPEQARGKAVDKRSDVWAFGALVYELLTARRLFDGETVSDVLAAVLTREPEWTALPAATPATVRRLLERCLERDPKLRLRDIGEARIVLAGARQADEPALAAARASGPRFWLPAGAGFAAAALVFAAYLRLGSRAAPDAPVRKLDLAIEGLEYSELGLVPVLSPDGRRMVYSASGGLWLRDLAELQPRVLPDSEGARYASWSPDGRHVAYVMRDRLWTVPVDGGQPAALGAVPKDLAGSGGTAWSDDGQIVASGSDSVGLLTLRARGGEGRELIVLDRAREIDFHEVSALPGGRGFVFIVHRSEGSDTIGLYASGERSVLLQLPGEILRSPVYSPTGHILYRRASTSPGIWAVAFSLDRLTASGAPFLVIPGGSAPSLGVDGSLALVRSSEMPSELVWVDRGGTIDKIMELPGTAGFSGQPDVSSLDLSADGRRAVVNISRDGAGELWVSDLVRGSTSRLTPQQAVSLSALWTPDGHVVFTSLFGGQRWNLFRVAPGSSSLERLTHDDAIHNPKAVSPDGRFLVFTAGAGRSADLWYLPLDLSGKAVPWQQTPANDGISASFSPDGRFLAYESDETGRAEVYVRPFPSGEGLFQVSTDGGQAPSWSAAADEILYRSRDRMLAATVWRRGAGLEIDKPRQLFVVDPDLMREFCPAPDGRRLLMLRSRRQDRVTLVLNWPRELARLAAAGRDER